LGVKSLLPATGTQEFLNLLSPFIPDDFINQLWPKGKTGGRRSLLSAAQLWRVHLLALLSPVHSFNLLVRLLGEQKAWRHFAHLHNLAQLPDVRMLSDFRLKAGVSGLRQINDHLLEPIMDRLVWPSFALMDATDLPASCAGFKKKHRTL
jgi:hypothetical protein